MRKYEVNEVVQLTVWRRFEQHHSSCTQLRLHCLQEVGLQSGLEFLQIIRMLRVVGRNPDSVAPRDFCTNGVIGADFRCQEGGEGRQHVLVLLNASIRIHVEERQQGGSLIGDGIEVGEVAANQVGVAEKVADIVPNPLEFRLEDWKD